MVADSLTGDSDLRLPEFDVPPADPIALLRRWVAAAGTAGVREPLAVTLASVDEQGRASTRTVLLKEVDHGGLVFGSQRRSRKGRDLSARPWAAVGFYWREALQQVNLAGPVTPTDDEESDRLFRARPMAAQAASAVSAQSEELTDEAALRAAASRLVTAGGPIERPADWCGYRLSPSWIEFWHGNPDRLHRRLRYDRTRAHWTAVRLQP